MRGQDAWPGRPWPKVSSHVRAQRARSPGQTLGNAVPVPLHFISPSSHTTTHHTPDLLCAPHPPGAAVGPWPRQSAIAARSRCTAARSGQPVGREACHGDSLPSTCPSPLRTLLPPQDPPLPSEPSSPLRTFLSLQDPTALSGPSPLHQSPPGPFPPRICLPPGPYLSSTPTTFLPQDLPPPPFSLLRTLPLTRTQGPPPPKSIPSQDPTAPLKTLLSSRLPPQDPPPLRTLLSLPLRTTPLAQDSSLPS